ILSIGIYGNTPPVKLWSSAEFSDIQQEIEKEKLPDPIEKANGILKVEAYTIIYKKDGTPDLGIVLGHLENGSRTLAVLKPETRTLTRLSHQELVGRKFRVLYNEKNGFNFLITTEELD
ncbi:MAG: hypothetical protein ACFE8N_14190, partial [Promethearchaeota archaeon]